MIFTATHTHKHLHTHAHTHTHTHTHTYIHTYTHKLTHTQNTNPRHVNTFYSKKFTYIFSQQDNSRGEFETTCFVCLVSGQSVGLWVRILDMSPYDRRVCICKRQNSATSPLVYISQWIPNNLIINYWTHQMKGGSVFRTMEDIRGGRICQQCDHNYNLIGR